MPDIMMDLMGSMLPAPEYATKEYVQARIAEAMNTAGSGPSVVLEHATFNANGTYQPDPGKAWDEVSVAVAVGMNWNGISGVSVDISNQTVDTDNAVFDFGSLNVTFVAKKLTSTQNDATLEIKCNNLTFQQSAFADVGGSSQIRTVILSCANNPAPSAEFTKAGKIARFLGKPFHATNLGTYSYKRFNSPNLVEAYFLPNKIENGGGFDSAAGFADECLVSLSNALKEGLATPQTITISNATTKAKCSTIVGTVSEVTEEGETYHMFTQDADGSTTLLDFITNTKGWTVA